MTRRAEADPVAPDPAGPSDTPADRETVDRRPITLAVGRLRTLEAVEPLSPGAIVEDGPSRRTSERLPLRACRDALPGRLEISDLELERVRDELYALAEVILDAG